MDRINGLSDDIICYILSFLAIKESALTSVLSKRWRYLFAMRTNLHLDDVDFGSGESFTDFVGRVLAVSGDFPLRDFSVRCGKSVDSGHVTGWMYEVLKRGIVSLDIDVTGHEEAILVPPEIFTCKTMVELKLGQGIDAMIPDHVYLPSLKTLSLDSIYFFNTQYCVLGKLLSSCPVLEELTIRSGSWQNGNCCRTLSSSSLKKLTMKCPEGSSHFWDMTLDTPSLAYLDYSDIVPSDYPIVNLASLVEAKLDLCLYRGASNPTNLIKGLRNVQVLELSSDTSRMFYHCCEAIPLLSSLSHLSIAIDFAYDWKYFPVLIRKSPNLQTLVIKGQLHANEYDGDYELPCPVKVLKISEYGGRIGELRRMKHFLEKLSCLELVEVCACATSEKEKFRIIEYLLMLPRSSKCKIEIKFSE